MRITFVAGNWVNMSGGARVVSIYAEYFHRLGHEVLVICPKKRVGGGVFSRIRKLFKVNRLFGANRPEASHFGGLAVPRKVLSHGPPVTDVDLPDGDVVIATWWETAEWVNALSDAKGAKVYFIQHHELHNYLPVARVRETYFLPLHKIVIARWLDKIMRSEYGDNVVDLVPNSVDHNQFFAEPRGKQSAPTVGFLYARSRFKGMDITLKAIGLLRDQFPDLEVITFGSIAPEPTPELDPRIVFHHRPEQDNIRNLYASCDVWITSSRTEGFNLPAMEAMACRTPIVSTKAGWPEESVKDGYNGYLVDVDDVDAIVDAAASVLSLADEDWRKMSQNAFDTVKNSTWEASGNLLEKALQHACQRAKRGEISGACACADTP